jgi:proteasome lid subunit RPN8/RPN11
MGGHAMSTSADFRRIDDKDTTKAKFPLTVEGEYRVHATQGAFEQMKAHADTTDEVELCGVLVGDVCRDEVGNFLLIKGVIEGEGSNNYGAQVTFTHQTWEHINAIKDRDFPDNRIVGWYHTHPGFGVFLSSMDSFIQENFFNQPYQVAIVLETKQNKVGCFNWVDGASTPLRRMWVGEREMALTGGEVDAFAADSGSTPAAKPALRVESSQERPGLLGLSPGSILLMGGLLIVGLLIGRSMATGEIRQQGLLALQSELYSLMEFAAVNATAATDIDDVRKEVLAIGDTLSKGDNGRAGTRLTELAALMESLAKAYGKKRSAYRNDLEQLVYRKQHLSERIESASRRQETLEDYVADLMIMRAIDVIQRSGEKGVAELGPQETAQVSLYIKRAMKLSPRVKATIEQILPGLLEKLYPSSGAEKEKTE